jgi:phosphatidylglycerophosphatase C
MSYIGYITAMTDSGTMKGGRCVAVFDLDGTLTWHDSLLPFLRGYLRRHPRRLLRFWRLPLAVLGFLAVDRDRGVLKSRLIRMVMGGDARTDIDAFADAFVASLPGRRAFRPAALAALEAHRQAGDRLALLSASPDLYVPKIAALLGIETAICTELEWRGGRLDGRLKTPNRRGAEKSRCLAQLRLRFPGLPLVAYGNSASDLPHMTAADRALLVNANATARRAAASLGIPNAEWN